MELRDRVAIITGGASGLGAATARRFAAAGATVAILDRDSEGAANVAAETGGMSVDCDVSTPESVEAAVGQVLAALGPPRIAVCCAGVGSGKRMIGRRGPHGFEIFDKVVRINLMGTFDVIRHVCWALRDTEPVTEDGERGVMITTSSIAAFDGVDGGVAYSASKAGVAGMTLPMARDLGGHGIRVVSIAPGSFATPMVAGMPPAFEQQLARDTPFPERLGIDDEYAAMAQHIVENSMLNGSVIRLDGGLRMQPSPGWKA